jgi:hypothetical protein
MYRIICGGAKTFGGGAKCLGRGGGGGGVQIISGGVCTPRKSIPGFTAAYVLSLWIFTIYIFDKIS